MILVFFHFRSACVNNGPYEMDFIVVLYAAPYSDNHRLIKPHIEGVGIVVCAVYSVHILNDLMCVF